MSEEPSVIDKNMCNCRNRNSCPLQNECLTPNIVYKAEISTADTHKVYFGLCETAFKTRYANHLKSFNNKKYASETELSKYLWELKNQNSDYSLKWSIASKNHSFRNGSTICSLCLEEKLFIMEADPKDLLNEKSELLSKCRHRNKFLLRNFIT